MYGWAGTLLAKPFYPTLMLVSGWWLSECHRRPDSDEQFGTQKLSRQERSAFDSAGLEIASLVRGCGVKCVA